MLILTHYNSFWTERSPWPVGQAGEKAGSIWVYAHILLCLWPAWLTAGGFYSKWPRCPRWGSRCCCTSPPASASLRMTKRNITSLLAFAIKRTNKSRSNMLMVSTKSAWGKNGCEAKADWMERRFIIGHTHTHSLWGNLESPIHQFLQKPHLFPWRL